MTVSLAAGLALWSLSPTGPTPPTTAPSIPPTVAPSTTVRQPCHPLAPEKGGFSPSLDVLVSGLGCVEHLTLVDGRDLMAVRTSGLVAAERGGPILPWQGVAGLETVIATLDPTRITIVGQVPPELAPRAERLAPRVIPHPDTEPIEGAGGMVVVGVGESEATRASWKAYARTLGWGFAVEAVDDLRAMTPRTRWILAGGADPVVIVGAHPEQEWQLGVVRGGAELPGGGLLLFPGRRIVALYGSPGFPALGVMGEQSPAESVERLRRVAAGYDADGTEVLLGFDLIATVAAAGPGEDGDYSFEQPIETIRPWVEEAERQGLYVMLDLQSGRTDFLTQAKRYEELLRLPHVGLALDPEWRLGPDQVHLRQIGTVDAAEINRVGEWLAGIVREEGLPQKLFMIHQFKLSMITNRDLIAIPPELAVVIQMDGQGPLGTKYDTYDALLSAGPNPGWEWGWKNFYDEDSPMASPEQVLALEPIPAVVTFQ